MGRDKLKQAEARGTRTVPYHDCVCSFVVFFVHGQELGQEGVECFQQDVGKPESYSVRVKQTTVYRMTDVRTDKGTFR